MNVRLVAAASLFLLGGSLSVALAQQLGEEAARNANAAEPELQIKLFFLEYAAAEDVQRIVAELFSDGPAYPQQGGLGGFSRGTQRRSFKTSADPRTNTLLVHGPADQLARIEPLVQQLDRQTANDDASNRAARDDLPQRVEQLEKDVERLKRSSGTPPSPRGSTPPRTRPQNESQSRSGTASDVQGTPIRCSVSPIRGSSVRVVSMVPAGKEVKEGDMLVEFDKATWEAAVAGHEANIDSMNAELRVVNADLERTVVELESQQAEVKHAVENAKLQLASFLNGVRKVKQKELEAGVKLAEIDLIQKQRQVNAGQLDSVALEGGEAVLEIARLKLEAFVKFEAPQVQHELEGQVNSAERRLKLTILESEAKVKIAEAERAGLNAAVDVQRRRIEELAQQRENYVVLAPHDGIVAEFPPGNPTRAGSMVRQGQTVLFLQRRP